ncbi:hypothetical protein DICPUDRAFT_157533 [Dictyostelium purpureum]|uniref:DUF4419 domain-containing protein n=1 Tax=Dictyostelium purpureum TaxID=5786 RepID=F0ZZC9_DICPU|nr:uncharacterized protein DICPUDRAFT_157533 [Dictyostelium purpureum]EGC30711.1 hypothetical protein DICPUDRAFT_157533 [Dictyostelium purpureum]|eukprot:XP_003292774.1 hypothetical protein DICPUDRAFT_157533 [Dictyostelium purpureum]
MLSTTINNNKRKNKNKNKYNLNKINREDEFNINKKIKISADEEKSTPQTKTISPLPPILLDSAINNNNNNNNNNIDSKIQSLTFKVDKDVEVYQVDSTFKFNHIKMVKSNTTSQFLRIDKAKEKDSFITKTNIKNSSKSIGNNNSFVWSAIHAFSFHHKLIIRPDDIWMAILNVFSIFFNNNLGKLRNKFVSFSGKKELTVATNYPIFDAPMDELIKLMTVEIKSNIKDPSISDWLIPSFTTTTKVDKVVYAASLMSTLKGFFDYKFSSRCGLPEVTLLGSVDDWVDIKNRFCRFKDYDCKTNQMNQWSELLNPVLDKFIETAQGNPDIKWWNSISRYNGVSGGPYITGWITCFCIYDITGKYVGDRKDESMVPPRGEEKELSGKWLTLKANQLIKGYVSTPVVLKDINGICYNSELYCGHITVDILDKNTLKPNLDWCLVINKTEIPSPTNNNRNNNTNNKNI